MFDHVQMWLCEAFFLQSLCAQITNNLGFLAFLLQGIMMCNATLSSLSPNADTRGRHSRSFWGHYSSMETCEEDGKVPLMPKTIKERVLWSITQNTKKHTLEFLSFLRELFIGFEHAKICEKHSRADSFEHI